MADGEWGLTGGQIRDGWSNETRLVSNQDKALKWIAGFYYGEANSHDVITGYLDYPAWFYEDTFDLDMINESTMKAVFGEASYDLLDGDLTVLLGLRWYEEERKAIARDEDVLTGEADKDFDGVSPRVNVAYYPSDNGMFYVNIAQGTRSGLINLCEEADADDDPSNGCQNEHLLAIGWSQDIQIIDADTIWSYEVGTKWSLLDGAMTVMASGYYNKWVDFQGSVNFRQVAEELVWVEDPPGSENWIQVLDVTATQGSIFANIGDLDLWGAQVQISWRPTASIGIDWSGSWNTGEWADVINDASRGLYSDNGAREGADVMGSAKWTSNLNVSYATTLGNYDLFASASWSVDDILTDFPATTVAYSPVTIIPDSPVDYGTAVEAVENREDFSLNIGVSRGRWTALLYANNLLNADKPINGGSSLSAATRAGGFVPHPRTIGLRISIDFGGENTTKGPTATMPGGKMGK